MINNAGKMEYTLHIDIPLGHDIEKAKYKSNLLVKEFLDDNVNFSGKHILKEKYDIEEVCHRFTGEEGQHIGIIKKIKL